jgi:DNA-binding LacI/PurR family transcriptional regulator
VTLGPENLYPDLHTVQFDFFENLRLAWRKLTEHGCQRIGLVYHQIQGWRTGHAWRAAFEVEHFLSGRPPHQQIPLELTSDMGTERKERYRAWLQEGNYDGVITSVKEIEAWRDPEGPSPEIALFNVNRTGQQGVDLNIRQLARTAMEVLFLEMQRSLSQEQGLPFRIHIPGNWVEASLPDS